MTDAAAAKTQEKPVVVEKGLHRKIVESSLYDWHPAARFLLSEIAVLRMDEDDKYPDDAPKAFKADKVDWCWMSQARLGRRVGLSESQVQRLITQFRKDGAILYRDWHDNNKTHHAEYKIAEKVFDAFQRPSQTSDEGRPPRYKKSRKGMTSKRVRGSNGTWVKKTAVNTEDEE